MSRYIQSDTTSALDDDEPLDSVIHYTTRGGARIRRTCARVDGARAIEAIAGVLDHHRGVLLASSYEYPGRYTRWDIGFARPPLAIEGRERSLRIAALEPAGEAIVLALAAALEAAPEIDDIALRPGYLAVTVATPRAPFTEEQRTRQPTLLSIVRRVRDFFYSEEDPQLGLYGAFGYDLAFQFEPIRLARPRSAHQRDLVLFLPDDLVVVDHARGTAYRYRYTIDPGAVRAPLVAKLGRASGPLAGPPPGDSSEGLEHAAAGDKPGDHAPGEYAATVRSALEAFARGDLFEVTTSQTFCMPTRAAPSALFAELQQANPAPYGFLVNLGKGEHLIGASPEMYVRVEGDRVETCPIAGTIARGRDALEDAEQVRRLLGSAKDEAELTMCTDVDRNDKSRICRPGSVRVLARRQIETYSRLLHTVDHVEGRLGEGFDALDAFLAHAWAVTVTGAPKTWAMQFIEDHEKSPRGFYGGAVGRVRFDGNLDTGLVLRTIHLVGGIARVRAGATLLFASDPDEEERETRLKASALLDVIRSMEARASRVAAAANRAAEASEAEGEKQRGASGGSFFTGEGRRILLVDHDDSFVHTLAGYFRETGALVVTVRAKSGIDAAGDFDPDLIVLSPGPGRPSDFDLASRLERWVAARTPVFGVCLGLQGIVESFGGALGRLERPMHGVSSRLRVLEEGRLFSGLPAAFVAGRYHSLFAKRDTLPRDLRVTAESEDGVVMAIEHAGLPIAAVQFHPESVMTLGGGHGRRIVRNVVERLARPPFAREGELSRTG